MSSKEAKNENTLLELKRFFTSADEALTFTEFKAEWEALSDEEKAWFRKQPLK